MSPPEATAARAALSAEEIERYGRHLVLPEVGREGQERLKTARVLLVGAGGLGSPAALYLAAAGVGTLGLVDFDRVERSNLQRQVLFGEGDVGRVKVAAARERLAEVNPHVEVETHEARLSAANALDLVGAYDLVVDGSDNAVTRYLVNDACVIAGRRDVWGAVARFEGQVAVFGGSGGPCYRCLFPEPPPPGLVASCAEGGVLGVLPGVVGALQASEALKLLLGIGEPAFGRLVVFDALRLRFREVRVPADPSCPTCGRPAAERKLEEVAPGCPTEKGRESREMTAEREGVPFEIGVGELADWLRDGQPVEILDVREPQEHAICRLEEARLIPLRELPERCAELDPSKTFVVYCHHGGRSAQAVTYLRQRGLTRAISLAGGIDAWSLEVDPSVPRY